MQAVLGERGRSAVTGVLFFFFFLIGNVCSCLIPASIRDLFIGKSLEKGAIRLVHKEPIALFDICVYAFPNLFKVTLLCCGEVGLQVAAIVGSQN
ncbi:hypothetical protein MPH_02610, partial [Macrophomina phaseolina MS6]